jgi:hypothetical protein
LGNDSSAGADWARALGLFRQAGAVVDERQLK